MTSEQLQGILKTAQATVKKTFPTGRAKHQKTKNSYKVVTVALEEATLSPVVVYEDSEGLVFTRPLDEFLRKFQ